MFTETIFIARTQVLYANVVVTGFSIARALAAVIGCMVFGVDRLENWAFWHGATYALGAMGCMFALWSFGPPRWHIVREEIWHGIHAATPQLLSNLRQNIDRPVLAAVTTPSIVGAYSLSSSIVQYSFVTINSFSRLFYPKLALAGQNGTSATCDLAIKYCPVIIGIGIITSIGLFFFAPLLPWVFGNGFTESVRYLKIMCWIPIFVAIHNIAYDALGASENHRIRAFLFNITALGGTGLIAGLTYFYGVYGAFASIFISQTILSIIMWFNLVRLGNNTRRLQR
jgi:O-antigen/teichoic acid export membrane protein